MNKEIKMLDKKNSIIRITTVDERWYAKPFLNKKTGIPESYEFIPSVTWITSHYPKGIAFYKWLATKGWSEAESIKQAAGDKGSKIHYAVEDLVKGKEVKMDDQYINKSTGLMEELTIEEYEALMSFNTWFEKIEMEVIATEITLFNNEHGYAGTADLVARIDGNVWIVDYKSGQYVWPEHNIQISAYSHLDFDLKELKITKEEWENRKLAILQLGYKRNKMGYKFTEMQDKFDLFLSTKNIWANECNNISPKQRDYPLSIKLDMSKKKKVETKKIINK